MKGSWFLAVTLAGAAALVGCHGAAPATRNTPFGMYVAVPPSDITAVELRRSGCYGTCPAYEVRFTVDDRATYSGEIYAPRQGRYGSLVDFARLAAWVDSQHPELLAPAYADNIIDSQRTTLIVERGTTRAQTTTTDASQAPLRFHGIVWALDGIAAEVHWRRVDDLTPLLGEFARNDVAFTILFPRRSTKPLAYSRTRFCAPPGTLEASRAAHGVRLQCGTRTSTLTATAAGLHAVGNAVPPGDYTRISQREADRRNGIAPNPEPT